METPKHSLDQSALGRRGLTGMIPLIVMCLLVSGQSVRARGFVAAGGGGRGFVAAGGGGRGFVAAGNGYRGGYAYRGYGYGGYGYRGFGYGAGAAAYHPALPAGYRAALPAGAAAVSVMGHRYYYANGFYYNPVFYGGSTVYVVTNP